MKSASGDQPSRPAELRTEKVLKVLEVEGPTAAWAECNRALAEESGSPELLVLAASILMKLDRAPEAERYVLKAAELRPDSPVIWNNLGLALRNQNRLNESLACVERALQLDPAFARAHYDRAFTCLLSGDYVQGFAEYEHRWAANGLKRPGDDEAGMRSRLWQGEDPAGKRLLLYAEQGLGDTIQFARYAAPLRRRGAEIVFEVQPALRGVIGWLEPRCEVGEGDGSVSFDLHCPLMTLPLLFGTTPPTIPPPAVFTVPKEKGEKWGLRIPAGNRLRVGLVWAGNPQNPMDDRRSTRLPTFEPFLSSDLVRARSQFFSFQVGPPAVECNESPWRDAIEDLSPELGEATDTAAALLQMDVVITVDTFVAHLAASLGVPVWLLLPFAPDWRWLVEREDSPWYPSMRLFRQATAGDWSGVADRVRDALDQRASGRRE